MTRYALDFSNPDVDPSKYLIESPDGDYVHRAEAEALIEEERVRSDSYKSSWDFAEKELMKVRNELSSLQSKTSFQVKALNKAILDQETLNHKLRDLFVRGKTDQELFNSMPSSVATSTRWSLVAEIRTLIDSLEGK